MSLQPLPVLIVEDDAALREALRDTLELSGYRVICLLYTSPSPRDS